MEPLGTGFPLEGIRVIETGDSRGEFAGKLLSNLGAEVIKVEPPSGSASREIGPFFKDEESPDLSLYWWHYNTGKQGVTLDLHRPEGLELLGRFLEKADVFIETFGPGGLEELGMGWDVIHQRFPRLVVLSVSDFGLDGPWANYQGSDLIALATGGQMMGAGYPPPDGKNYDTPPIAPQMHQSWHLVGCQGANDVLAALAHRDRTGRGQRIDLSLHSAANACTENHLSWYMIGGVISPRGPQFPEMFTGDGRYMQIMLGLNQMEWERIVDLLESHGMAEDLRDPLYANPLERRKPEIRTHIDEVVQAFLATQTSDDVFRAAQERGVIWSPIREPHESLEDDHYVSRGNFTKIEHEDLGESFDYPHSPWVSEQMPWRTGPRAPHVGEHNQTVYTDVLGLDPGDIAALRAAGTI